MIAAGGIDLGGTKIEAQAFDADWNVLDKRRLETPQAYPALVAAVADQIDWLRRAAPDLPVGVAAAGLQSPKTGHWIAANLSANGKPFVADVAQATGQPPVWLNDCRAFTLAEAKFGAGKAPGTMIGLLLGTGIAGGVASDGELVNLGAGQSGEFGHMPIAATVLTRLGLPVLACGCGRMGCVETYGSGPGMQRLAQHLLGRALTPREIVAGRADPDLARVWRAWCDINAAMILTIITVIEPKTIVLGGGLSKIDGVTEALTAALQDITWKDFPLPTLHLAARGETAGALGAAYAACHV